MKLTSLISILLFSCTTISAQVFSFIPTIRFTSMYSSDTKNTWLSSKIDTVCTIGKVIINMDNKTISDPESILRPLGLYAIKSVTYDEGSRMYTLEVTDPFKMSKFLFFRVKLNSKNEIIYLKKVRRYKGSSFKGDTTFSTFTNHLTAIEFSINSHRMKENLLLSADPDKNLKEINKVYDAPFADQDTRAEMRDGYFSWTEGKGSNMKYHSYPISEIRLKNEEGLTEGFEFICNESDSVYYKIMHVNTHRYVVARQYGWQKVIVITKFENNKSTAFSIIESY